ncbi:hypothetical protein NUW58_g5079 [Xylaria curta]|uniref:Uncharacterized protein n=1 Tax=Xylaria curta TaxID=42375 RepID=A0ACC1P3W3_9PEZI|nr:hypothetical protein NUW58_g5079 [Xylaria curta]
MSTQGLAFTGKFHVQNQTWTAVDSYTQEHVHPPTTPYHQVLLDTLRNSRDKGLPDIATAPVVAKMYALQCKAKNVKHALEFGTLGGYTSIWLAALNPELQVTSLEINEHHKAVAQQNVEHAGVADRVAIRLGPALDLLPQLAKDIESGAKPRLGFVYIDADKENNWNYMDRVIPLCEPGCCYLRG